MPSKKQKHARRMNDTSRRGPPPTDTEGIALKAVEGRNWGRAQTEQVAALRAAYDAARRDEGTARGADETGGSTAEHSGFDAQRLIDAAWQRIRRLALVARRANDEWDEALFSNVSSLPTDGDDARDKRAARWAAAEARNDATCAELFDAIAKTRDFLQRVDSVEAQGIGGGSSEARARLELIDDSSPSRLTAEALGAGGVGGQRESLGPLADEAEWAAACGTLVDGGGGGMSLVLGAEVAAYAHIVPRAYGWERNVSPSLHKGTTQANVNFWWWYVAHLDEQAVRDDPMSIWKRFPAHLKLDANFEGLKKFGNKQALTRLVRARPWPPRRNPHAD